ncbi:hypothetical protein VTG60DRAFT_3679 [Thermothelomyces hinnuleus]
MFDLEDLAEDAHDCWGSNCGGRWPSSAPHRGLRQPGGRERQGKVDPSHGLVTGLLREEEHARVQLLRKNSLCVYEVLRTLDGILEPLQQAKGLEESEEVTKSRALGMSISRLSTLPNAEERSRDATGSAALGSDVAAQAGWLWHGTAIETICRPRLGQAPLQASLAGFIMAVQVSPDTTGSLPLWDPRPHMGSWVCRCLH